jgi:hypothetical protein
LQGGRREFAENWAENRPVTLKPCRPHIHNPHTRTRAHAHTKHTIAAALSNYANAPEVKRPREVRKKCSSGRFACQESSAPRKISYLRLALSGPRASAPLTVPLNKRTKKPRLRSRRPSPFPRIEDLVCISRGSPLALPPSLSLSHARVLLSLSPAPARPVPALSSLSKVYCRNNWRVKDIFLKGPDSKAHTCTRKSVADAILSEGSWTVAGARAIIQTPCSLSVGARLA